MTDAEDSTFPLPDPLADPLADAVPEPALDAGLARDSDCESDRTSEEVATPWQVLAAWPPDRRVALLNRGVGEDPLPRWTLLTEPVSPTILPPPTGARSPQDADRVREWLARHLHEGPLASNAPPVPMDADTPPWAIGTIALLAYELGARLEPAAAASAAEPRRPDAGPGIGRGTTSGTGSDDRSDARWDGWIAKAPWSIVFDHRRRRWIRTGPVPAWVDSALRADARPAGFQLQTLSPTESDERFEELVRRCVELVHAGDLFQANLSRGFEARMVGDPRGLAAAALADGARFGGYVETGPDEAVLSLSPELLVAVEPGGIVRTCPIKGTRPAGSDLAAFAADAKDAAELAMIVDLMRNDLGRVCRPGSIRVVEARRFERHPTIVHGVAEIEGRLRDDLGTSEFLQALFPAGSISGAPKIRAMQVIESLENARRGIYCGSIGWFDERGEAMLNVAIRTASLHRERDPAGWRLAYRAGCGIVADSDPSAERRESRDKTAVLARLAGEVMRPDGAETPADAVAPRSPRRPVGPPVGRARHPR